MKSHSRVEQVVVYVNGEIVFDYLNRKESEVVTVVVNPEGKR